ncbi:hypothetical protein PR048_013240 [Dryococelus australis]|uniref:DUF659 domain-containing protein n=1 Tax=Dryococelus australis TaxID=614101 RepID=A0ABQ9HRL8_9NEOP|nr:hypothetical protein PR048_013240 [Dryococelus australis]
MVACDFQPFSIVEDKGFRGFVKSLDPKYELLSKTNLRNKLLPCIYEECNTKLWIMLEKVSYVSVTYNKYGLSTNTMTCSHTAENIAAEVSKISKDWNLEKKVCCIVTDNAASM